MYRLELHSTRLPLSTNVTDNYNRWQRAEYRRSWRLWVKMQVGRKRPPQPLERARITVEVWAAPAADRMNMRQAFKPIIDGLCPEKRHTRKGKPVVAIGAGVIADDSPSVIGDPEFIWHDCEPKQACFCLVVEAIEPEDLVA